MLLKFILSLFLMIECQFLFAQEIKFNIKENWLTFSRDDNFRSSAESPWSNPYNLKFIKNMHLYQDDLYTFETTFSQAPYAGPEGYMINKINPENGSILWTAVSNIFTGIKYREEFSSSFPLFEGKQIKFYGYKSNDTLKSNQLQEFFQGKVVEKTVDIETGEVIERIGDSKPSIFNYSNPGYANIYSNKIGNLFRIFRGYNFSNGFIFDSVSIYNLDENLIQEEFPAALINNHPGVINDFLINFIPTVADKKSDTLKILFQTKSDDFAKSVPSKSLVKLIDVSNLKNIKVIDSIDISSTYPVKKPNDKIINTEFRNINGVLFYSGFISNHQNNNLYNFFNWFDNNTSKYIAGVKKSGYQNNNYLRLFPIGVIDKKLYLTGLYKNPLLNGKVHVDIISLSPGDTIFTFHKTLRPLSAANLRVDYAKIYKDNVIFGFDADLPPSNDRYVFYASFKMKDLGIETTQTNDKTDLPQKVQLYPNPSQGIVKMKFESPFTGLLKLNKINGQELITNSLQGVSNYEFSVNQEGIYFINLISNSGQITTKMIYVLNP